MHPAGLIQLNFLGTVEGRVDGRSVHFRTRKSVALVAYLAVNPGPHSREMLADLLWPGIDLRRARARLRNALTYVREAFGRQKERALASSRDSLSLNKVVVSLDLDVLLTAEQLARQPLNGPLRREIETAARLYRAQFLDGLCFSDAPQLEDWVDGQRARWQTVEGRLLERLSNLQLEAGDPPAVVATLERWTTIDPSEELAWQRLIETHLQLDDQLNARRAWSASARIMEQLGIEPSEAIKRLYDQAFTPELAVREAPLPAASKSAGYEVPFVGRAEQWAQLLAAYRSAQRGRPAVIFLDGPPGGGKSRLASEFASALDLDHADLIRGRGLKQIRALPYAAVVDGLRRHLERENAPDDWLPDPWLAELSRLLPELRERYPDLAVPIEDRTTRGRMFEAVARFTLALAKRRVLVWIVDDVQWADVESRDLLRYAVRRWIDRNAAVLLILIAGDDAPVTVKQWLAGLQRETGAKRLSVGPLQPGDVTRLVAMLAGEDERKPDLAIQLFSRWLADRTERRPLAMTETIGRLITDGVLQVYLDADSHVLIDFPDPDRIAKLEAPTSH